jgi:arylsulfatase A
MFTRNLAAICVMLFIQVMLVNAALAADRKPNIVLIVADDLGYAEVGCYGQKLIKTPNIDRIAAQGMRFTQFYAGSPVCAPSRCTLITGKHTGHSYIRNNGYPRTRKKDPDNGLFPGQHPIPDAEITIAEVLKAQGYATGAMGKWGLGPEGSTGDPNKQGFDLFFGFICQWHAHNHYPRFLWRNTTTEQKQIKYPGNDRKLEGKTHSQDEFVREALAFVNANKDKPFFLYLPFAIPHLSIQTTDHWINQYKDKIPEAQYKHKGYLKHPLPHAGYAGMVSQMDDGVGQVMKLIKDLGLDDDTLIIFTSDNGPTFARLGGADSDYFESSGPLRGRKGSVYDGGIRVPLVARWPGKIKPGTISGHQSAFWDFLPTLAEIAGAKDTTPKDIDGISFAPTLLGKGKQKEHPYLYWEFNAYGGQQAVRMGDWKAVRQGMAKGNMKIELYNLGTDIGESKDVAAANPKLVEEMRGIMKTGRTPSKLFKFKQLD